MKPIKKAVFPVAGMGTRFLPATKASPKEMLTLSLLTASVGVQAAELPQSAVLQFRRPFLFLTE